MPDAPAKAGVSLKFIVVGGSIAGLASAYALKKAGHDVLVLEKSDGKAQSKGGLQSPPNMTKILNEWGLQPALDQLAHKCERFIFRNGESGEHIGTMIMDEAFLKDLLADFLFIQHQVLKDMIFELASQEGVRVAFETTVVDIHRSLHSVSVNLDTGRTLSADIVLIADGYDSPFRHLVTGVPDAESMKPSEKHLHVTFTLPVDLLNQDDELWPLMKLTDWLVWMGSGYVMHANLTNGGKDLTGTITYTYEREVYPEDLSWAERPLEYYGLDLDRFEPRPRKLIELARVVSARIVFTRLGPEELVCDQSKLVLVGEAAHPLLPGGNHRTALTFEDAHTLGCLFSRIQRRDQISHFLTAYEEIRHPHCERTHAYDNGYHALVRCPAGPEQEARDGMLRQTMAYGDWDHMDEATFRSFWGTELSLYVHDARESVDDWWTQWGSLITRQEQRQHQENGPQIASLIPGLHRVSVSSSGAA